MSSIYSKCCRHKMRLPWTRQRTLTFSMVITLILRGHKLPIQNSLNKVFGALDAVDHVPTASAYSQARRKLKPEVFLYLNTLVSDLFYQQFQASRLLKTWHGRRLLAADGTYLNVPDTPETRIRYRLQSVGPWCRCASI